MSMKREEILDVVDDAIFLDDLDEAILGFTDIDGKFFVCYSVSTIFDTLVDGHGMTEAEASEFFSYNIECLKYCVFVYD